MKVLIISNMYPSLKNPGYGSFVQEQAQSLIAQGIECIIVASSESRRGVRYVIPKYLSLIKKTLLAVLRYKFDIIHAHYIYPTAIIGYFASKIKNSGLIITVHGSVEPHMNSALSKKIMAYSIGKADHLIAVGTSVQDELVKYFTVDRSNISIIDMGIDTQLFTSTAKQNARDQLHLPHDKTILITIGTLIWLKGIHLLINSIAKFPCAYKDTFVIIIGDGPLKQELIDTTIKLGITENVKFVGTVEKNNIPLWLSASDILVHPALDEGFGLVVIEAMSCKKIVVASPVGGINDYTIDEVNGFLVQPWNSGVRSQWANWVDKNNIKILAEKISYVIALPDLKREQIVSVARTTAENHDTRKQAIKVEQIYNQVLKERNVL